MKIITFGMLFAVVFISNCTLNADKCYGQWVQMSNGMGNTQSVNVFAVSGNNLFAGTNNGVYVSTNNAANWTFTGLESLQVRSLAVSGTNIFASTFGSGIFLSTNNGANWTAVNNGLTGYDLYMGPLAVSGNILFAGNVGPLGNGIFRSTNSGEYWTNVTNGFTNSHHVNAISVSGTNVFAGTGGGMEYGGVLLSANNGINWTIVSSAIPQMDVWSLIADGANVYAGCQYTSIGTPAVFFSSNSGANWINMQNDLGNRRVTAFAINGNNVFAGTDSGVYITTNNGLNWINKNQGFNTIPSIGAFLITNNYIFTGTYGTSVWRRSLSEIIGVMNNGKEIPTVFSLNQNYPNPFNPSTLITYDLPESSFVKLIIYNELGQQVAVMVKEKKSAGTYEVTFNGALYPSGVYFCKFSAGDFADVKRMLLVK